MKIIYNIKELKELLTYELDSLSQLTNLKSLTFGSYYNQPLSDSLLQLKNLHPIN